MRTVRLLEGPRREAPDRSGDGREDGLSPEIRELILSFGTADQLSDGDSDSTLHLVKDEGRESSVSE